MHNSKISCVEMEFSKICSLTCGRREHTPPNSMPLASQESYFPEKGTATPFYLKEKKKLNENQGQNVKKYVLVQYAIANTKGKCWQNPENLGAHQKKRLLGHRHDKLLGRAVI